MYHGRNTRTPTDNPLDEIIQDMFMMILMVVVAMMMVVVDSMVMVSMRGTSMLIAVCRSKVELLVGSAKG